MSWYCDHCEEWIDVPDEREYIEEVYGPYRRITYKTLCPRCGEELEETEDCPVCGGHTLPKDTFCNDCKKEVINFVEDMAINHGTTRDVVEELVYECV